MNNIKVLQAAAAEIFRRYSVALDRCQRCSQGGHGKKALEEILFKRAGEMEYIYKRLRRAERRAGIINGYAQKIEAFRNN